MKVQYCIQVSKNQEFLVSILNQVILKHLEIIITKYLLVNGPSNSVTQILLLTWLIPDR